VNAVLAEQFWGKPRRRRERTEKGSRRNGESYSLSISGYGTTLDKVMQEGFNENVKAKASR
jgi:hypothetical protein